MDELPGRPTDGRPGTVRNLTHPTQGDGIIPTSQQSRKQSRNGNGGKAAKQQREPEAFGSSTYEETPGWGSAFHREDNEPPRPTYTGEGVLDVDTLKAIFAADGAFQISVWPKRTRNGHKILRFHIEPPYQGNQDAELDEDEFDGPADEAEAPDDDDMPF